MAAFYKTHTTATHIEFHVSHIEAEAAEAKSMSRRIPIDASDEQKQAFAQRNRDEVELYGLKLAADTKTLAGFFPKPKR